MGSPEPGLLLSLTDIRMAPLAKKRRGAPGGLPLLLGDGKPSPYHHQVALGASAIGHRPFDRVTVRLYSPSLQGEPSGRALRSPRRLEGALSEVEPQSKIGDPGAPPPPP